MNIFYALELEFSDDSFNTCGCYVETVAYYSTFDAAIQAINRLSVVDLLYKYRSIYMPGTPEDYILCEKEEIEGYFPTRLYQYNGATEDIVDGNDMAWFRVSIRPIYSLDIEDLYACDLYRGDWLLGKKTNKEEK
jgi:hypothetical protein